MASTVREVAMGANAQRLGAGDGLMQQLASVGGLDRAEGAGLGHHLVELIQLDGPSWGGRPTSLTP